MHFKNFKSLLYNSSVILFMVFLNPGCVQRNTNSENIVRITVGEAECLKKWSSDLSLITKSVVLNEENNFISHMTKLIFANDRYFIYDIIQRKILVFNSNGDFLNNIGTRGRGPGEYMELRDFQIYNNNVYLLDWNKIKIFNFDGIFQKELRLDELTEKMKQAPLQFGITKCDNYIFYVGSQGEYTKKEVLYVTDKNFKILGEYFTWDHGFPDHYRFYTGEHLFSGLLGNYNLYQIENGELTTKFYVDFGKDIVCNNVLKNKQRLADRIEREGLIYNLRNPYIASEYMSFEYSKGNWVYNGIYNMQSKKTFTSLANASLFGGGIICGTYKDEFILYYPLDRMVDTNAFVEFTNIKIPDNPVIVHVKFSK